MNLITLVYINKTVELPEINDMFRKESLRQLEDTKIIEACLHCILIDEIVYL